MRNAFADEITKLAQADERVVLLSGDIGNRLFDSFKEICPDRFFNCGVAEANMIGVAAGLAMSGFKPVAYTITPFITARCLEQIRVDLCYHDLSVLVVGVGAGLSYASLGPTHHACEDISFLRTLPSMRVLAPGDAMEVRGGLRLALQGGGPVYMRMGKKNEPVVHDNVPRMEFGRSIEVRSGGDVCLLVAGTLLPITLAAADALAVNGVEARVISMPSVKPLDTQTLTQVFKAFPLVTAIEEHSKVGGFGSAIAEWLVDGGGAHAPLLRINTPDHFIHSSGSQTYARETLGLTDEGIAARVLDRLKQLPT